MIIHISTRHDFSSLYFYRKLHLFMNFSLTKLQRRVSFFSNRLIMSQKDKYKQQIQTQKSHVSVNIFLTSLDQVPKGILTNTELIAARVGPLLTWENCWTSAKVGGAAVVVVILAESIISSGSPVILWPPPSPSPVSSSSLISKFQIQQVFLIWGHQQWKLYVS